MILGIISLLFAAILFSREQSVNSFNGDEDFEFYFNSLYKNYFGNKFKKLNSIFLYYL